MEYFSREEEQKAGWRREFGTGDRQVGKLSSAVDKSLCDTLRSFNYMYIMKYKLKSMPGNYMSYCAFK